jgi:hypothetical protein
MPGQCTMTFCTMSRHRLTYLTIGGGAGGGEGGGSATLLNLGRDKGGWNGIMRWHKVCSTHEIQRSTTENLQLPHPAFLSLTIAMAKDAA